MEMKLELQFHQGIDSIYFGMPIEETIRQLGSAHEVEVLDNIEEIQTTVLHYPELELALFFEEQEPVLKCIDISHPDTLINGVQVFSKTEAEIVEVMKNLNFFEQDIEIESWGEKRITFFEANVDYFFNDEKLTSIVLGA